MGKYFPLFVNLEKKKILVVGAGKIATRRIGALLEFGAHITVTAPKASKQVEAWAKEGRMACRLCEYRPGLIKDYFRDSDLVLAATSDPMVNEAVWAECKKLGIPVNVSSDKTKCDFYFPGLAVNGETVVGVTAGGSDHVLAKELTERIRKEVLRNGNEH